MSDTWSLFGTELTWPGWYRPMRTRGDMLRFASPFALIQARKLVRGLRQGLTQEERYRVADVVAFLEFLR